MKKKLSKKDKIWMHLNQHIEFYKQEAINHPLHYAGKIEVIDFIEDKKLGFHLGNVVKYISRAGKKTSDTLEDLQKAKWYLDRYLEKMK